MVSSFLQCNTKEHRLHSWLCNHHLLPPVPSKIVGTGWGIHIACSDWGFNCPHQLMCLGLSLKPWLESQKQVGSRQSSRSQLSGSHQLILSPLGFFWAPKTSLGASYRSPCCCALKKRSLVPFLHPPPAQHTCKHQEIFSHRSPGHRLGQEHPQGLQPRHVLLRVHNLSLSRARTQLGFPLGKAQVCMAARGWHES